MVHTRNLKNSRSPRSWSDGWGISAVHSGSDLNLWQNLLHIIHCGSRSMSPKILDISRTIHNPKLLFSDSCVMYKRLDLEKNSSY